MFAKVVIGLTVAAAAVAQTSDSDARITAAQGNVSVSRDSRPWAVSSGENIAAQQVLRTGPDGFVRVDLRDGGWFEVYSNSRVGFRRNLGTSSDVVDVLEGRARIHLQPQLDGPQQRVFTPVAIVSAQLPATIAIAIDGNDTTRLDVLDGEVRVQHRLLPRSEPTVVKAADAILIEPDEQISRRLDRGALYRDAVKLRDWIGVFTPGHGKPAQPVEQNQLLAVR